MRLKRKPRERRISPSKGTVNRHIIRIIQEGNKEMYLHATKGWRVRRK